MLADSTRRIAIVLSPRLRGNQRQLGVILPHRGSIPAPAGEPSFDVRKCRPAWVYPRACGGTANGDRTGVLYLGLSPRLRGNPIDSPVRSASLGSIPAPAGEPPTETGPASCTWVYPRACGGTRLIARLDQLPSGLSPRLRGNHLIQHAAQPLVRSIPAPAGEPYTDTATLALSGVYPRACGGTHDTSKSPSMR